MRQSVVVKVDHWVVESAPQLALPSVPHLDVRLVHKLVVHSVLVLDLQSAALMAVSKAV